MGIFEDILAAAETLIAPTSYAPSVSEKRMRELDQSNSQHGAVDSVAAAIQGALSNPGEFLGSTAGAAVRSPVTLAEWAYQGAKAIPETGIGKGFTQGLGLSSTPANQAAPLEVQRAQALNETNRARSIQKLAEAKAAEDNRAVTEMLSLLQSKSSPGTQSFAAKGDAMLAGPGLPGKGGNYSKTKRIPSEDEKTLKAAGLPAEFASANPEVLQLLTLLKQAGVMTPDEKEQASSKRKFDFLGEIMKSDTTDKTTREAILAQTLPEIFKLIQALKAAEENK